MVLVADGPEAKASAADARRVVRGQEATIPIPMRRDLYKYLSLSPVCQCVCVRNFLAKRKIMSASELDVLFPPTGKRACALDVAALEGLPRAALVDAPRRAPIALPPAKTEPCVAFAHLGRCPFGSSCLHRHESIPARASRGAHSDSSATAQLRKAFADSLDEARSHAANGRHADALKHYGSAEFLAESILTVESGGDAAALARQRCCWSAPAYCRDGQPR